MNTIRINLESSRRNRSRRSGEIVRREKKKSSVLFVFTLLILMILIFSANIFRPVSIEAHEPLEIITVIVRINDSLWKIADEYDNNKMDLRQYIYLIEKYNNLENKMLQPGQRLHIPIYN